MIVIFKHTGYLGNRLFLHAYGEALAEASGQKLYDFDLNTYAALFPATRPWEPRWLYRLFRKIVLQLIKLCRRFPAGRACFVSADGVGADFSPGNPAFIAQIKSRSFTFLSGLPYLAEMTFPAPEAVRAKLTPDAGVLDQIREQLAVARGGADILIGVHIRQGNYADYRDGIYYYSSDFYRQVMAALVDFFPGRKVAFLICSNESQPLEIFAPLKIALGPGTVLGDLYSLAGCDYVIGAPSTYSLWAAFYGRKPIHVLIKPQIPRSLDDFYLPDGRFECIDLEGKLTSSAAHA